jgi:integrase/recombinase XerD
MSASVLTNKEIKRCLDVISSNRHSIRNRMLFHLSHLAGMRVGEISSLTLADAVNNDGSIKQQINLSSNMTKGKYGRVVYLSTKLQKEIASYISTLRHKSPERPLIPSQKNNGHFSNVSLSIVFKRIYANAGINTSSHTGRRTFACTLNSKSVSTRTLQKLMGHRSISTTALYIDVSDDTLMGAVDLL